MRSTELPPIDQVIHHRGEVLLLDDVIEHDDSHTVARVDLSKKKWLQRSDGTTPGWIALEYMAQCIAVHEGLYSYLHDRDLHGGFLISVRDLEIHVREFAADLQLSVHARPMRGRPGLGALSHECSIYSAMEGSSGSLLARGRLSIFIDASSPE